MIIQTDMSGKDIDTALRAIVNALKDLNNNNKVIYIKRGKLAFEDGETLFNVATLK